MLSPLAQDGSPAGRADQGAASDGAHGGRARATPVPATHPSEPQSVPAPMRASQVGGRGALKGAPAGATTAICAGKPHLLVAGELARGGLHPVTAASQPPRGLSTSHQQRWIIA